MSFNNYCQQYNKTHVENTSNVLLALLAKKLFPHHRLELVDLLDSIHCIINFNFSRSVLPKANKVLALAQKHGFSQIVRHNQKDEIEGPSGGKHESVPLLLAIRHYEHRSASSTFANFSSFFRIPYFGALYHY